jgi:hypothetical protein
VLGDVVGKAVKVPEERALHQEHEPAAARVSAWSRGSALRHVHDEEGAAAVGHGNKVAKADCSDAASEQNTETQSSPPRTGSDADKRVVNRIAIAPSLQRTKPVGGNDTEPNLKHGSHHKL